MIRKSLITIDPGESTGWAYFEDDIAPKRTGCWQSKDDFVLQHNFNKLINRFDPDIVIMEDVQPMGLRSMAAAKNLNKLNRIIGRYQSECDAANLNYKMINVIKWKGTLKNKVLRKWIIEITGNDYHPVHTLCAVGIGLNERGLL